MNARHSGMPAPGRLILRAASNTAWSALLRPPFDRHLSRLLPAHGRRARRPGQQDVGSMSFLITVAGVLGAWACTGRRAARRFDSCSSGPGYSGWCRATRVLRIRGVPLDGSERGTVLNPRSGLNALRAGANVSRSGYAGAVAALADENAGHVLCCPVSPNSLGKSRENFWRCSMLRRSPEMSPLRTPRRLRHRFLPIGHMRPMRKQSPKRLRCETKLETWRSSFGCCHRCAINGRKLAECAPFSPTTSRSDARAHARCSRSHEP